MNTANIEEQSGLVIRPGEGRTTWVAGHPITHKVTGEHTNGAFSFFESSVPPSNGAPPHVHRAMDETYYVLDGTFEFHFGQSVTTGRAGMCLHVPRGIIHSFKNVGITWGRLLVIASPGGIEEGYVDLSNIDLEAPDCRAKVQALCERYQMEFFPATEEDLVFA